MMGTAAAPIDSFANQGLPQFTRLAAPALAPVTQALRRAAAAALVK